jgi:hypothetical protein
MMLFMRTTLNISDALLRDLRAKATESKRPFRLVVEEVLQRGLGLAKTRSNRARFTIKPQAVGIKPGFQSMSMNQLFDQIEAERDSKAG